MKKLLKRIGPLCGSYSLLGSACWSFNLQTIEAATRITLQPTLDTSILSTGANPKGNETILAGTQRNEVVDRGLLRFDLSAIPADSIIESVSLRLTVVMVPLNPANTQFSLHRLLKNWDGNATWATAKAGTPWGTPGAEEGVDYATNASGTQLITEALASFNFGPDPGLMADVQSWVSNPNTNFGWLLKSDSEDTPKSARHFGSSESASAPSLVIEYSTPVLGPHLTNVQVSDGTFSFRFESAENQTYRVEALAVIGSGGWRTVTNVPATATSASILVAEPSNPPRQFYRVVTP